MALAVTLSHAGRPIYTSSRFSMFVLPFFTIWLTLALLQVRPPSLRYGLTGLLMFGWLVLSVAQMRVMEKEDWHGLLAQWPRDARPAAIVYFPETYHSPFGYHMPQLPPPADRAQMEKLIRALYRSEIWVVTLNSYGFGAWPGQREYHDWLMDLGSTSSQALPCNLTLTRIMLSGQDRHSTDGTASYGPVDIPGIVRGFENPVWLHALEEDTEQQLFRWSKETAQLELNDIEAGTTITLHITMPPRIPQDYTPNLRVYAARIDAA